MSIPANVAIFSQAQIVQVIAKCSALILFVLQIYLLLPFLLAPSRNAVVYLTSLTVVIFLAGASIGTARDLYLIDVIDIWPMQLIYIVFALAYQMLSWTSFARLIRTTCVSVTTIIGLKLWLSLETMLTIATIVVVALPQLDSSVGLYLLMGAIFSQTLSNGFSTGLYLANYLVPMYKKLEMHSQVKQFAVVLLAIDLALHFTYIIAFLTASNYMTSLVLLCAAVQLGLFVIVTFRLQCHQEDIEQESLPSTTMRPRETYTDSVITSAPRMTGFSELTDSREASLEKTVYTNYTHSKSAFNKEDLQAMDDAAYQSTHVSLNESAFMTDTGYTDYTSYTDCSQTQSSKFYSEHVYKQSISHKPAGIVTTRNPETAEIMIYSDNSSPITKPSITESIIIFSPTKQTAKQTVKQSAKSVAESVDTLYLANKYGSLLEKFSPVE